MILPRFPALRSRVAWQMLLLLIAALLVWGYGPVLLHPGDYMGGSEGDSIKNYYTPLYHALYGSGKHFTGMLHPFGEHLVYTDGQPLLSMPLAALRQMGLPLTAGGLLALQNLLLLGSIPATALLLYAIMRRCWLPPWWAAGGALLLTLLAPQFERVFAHYALAYAFLVPALWYLLLRATEQTLHKGWMVAYLVVASLAGWLHPYYIPMSALLSGSHALVAAGQWQRKGRYPFSIAGWLLLMAIVPVVIFQGWMAMTDSILDRPSSPYGFLVYRATFRSVWLPIYEPLASAWQTAAGGSPPAWEGWAYVGLVPGLVLLLSLWRTGQYIWRGRWQLAFRPVLPPVLQRSLWAGILVLLFAGGVPFIFGLESWLEWLKPLRQFRSIGRFAWVFYYIWGVYAVSYLHLLTRYLNQRRAARFAVSLLVFLSLIWVAEGISLFKQRATRLVLSKEGQRFTNTRNNYTDLLSWAQRTPQQYQAILSLPFYLVGNEQLGVEGTRAGEWESMRASLDTGLPLCAAMMSRTSRHATQLATQLLTTQTLPREMLRQLPSRKPFLVLVTHPADLQPEEHQLLRRARLLISKDDNFLYELPLDSLSSAPKLKATARNRSESSYSTATDDV